MGLAPERLVGGRVDQGEAGLLAASPEAPEHGARGGVLAGALGGEQGQRQGVVVVVALGVLDADDGEDGVDHALLQRAERQDVLDGQLADLASLAGEPPAAADLVGQRAAGPALEALPAEPLRGLDGRVDVRRLGLVGALVVRGRLEHEPVERVRAEGEEVGQLADGGEAGVPEDLDGRAAREAGEVELDGLGEAREVGHDEDVLAVAGAEEGEGLGVVGVEELHAAAGHDRVPPAQGDEALHPPQEGGGVGLLALDVDRLVVGAGLDVDREEQPLGVGAAESGVAVGRPVHGRADGVAVAEVDVVAHADLVPVVDDGGAGHAHEQAVHELQLAAGVVEQG